MNGLPASTSAQATGHEAKTVPEMGWASIKNGALPRLAEPLFDIHHRGQNLPFQQNLAALHLAVIGLDTPDNKAGDPATLMDHVLTGRRALARAGRRITAWQAIGRDRRRWTCGFRP